VRTLQIIEERAAAKGLQFLLAGGHAVIAHGHQRATFDLDLIVRHDDREQWLTLVEDLGFRFLHEGPNFLQFNPSDANLLPIDLMLVNQETFGKLIAEAVPTPAILASAKIVSLRHLLALKCHAIKHGHTGRLVKDADDVIRLVQANGVNVQDQEMRDLFLKHGTAEFYEKICRICSQDRRQT
jgi:hypothetical protein